MEMFAPAANVPSIRARAIKLPPASTTAITPPGDLSSWAFAFAAAIMRSAPSSVSVFFSAVCPGARARLHHRRTERCLTEIYFRESTPNHDLLDVLYVARQNDFLFVVRADERFGLQLVEQIDVSVGIDNLPVWVGCIRNNKVVRQRENVLSVLRAVRDSAFVGLGALELR